MINSINKVEQLANGSKFSRLLNNPYKYLYSIFIKHVLYPISNKEKKVRAKLFYGKRMNVALPASTDIYLTGGKSHSSEIRLAKFLIHNLKRNDSFLDIGAHYGYFSLLASEQVGKEGSVMSFEPSNNSFTLLAENVANSPNITPINKAISDSLEPLTFYQFPNLYSEYNTKDVTQFQHESWFENQKPTHLIVEAATIDEITSGGRFNPQMIKIDVEGGEYEAIKGGIDFLKNNSAVVIMEFLSSKRHNQAHKMAADLLFSLGYTSYIINSVGALDAVLNVDDYLESSNLESDNIVFIKKKI